MNLQAITAIVAVLVSAMNFVHAYMVNQVRLQILQLRVEMGQARAQDESKFRAWVEAEFVRNSVCEARRQGVKKCH